MHTPRDPTTNQHKGVAYVTFRRPSDALAAYEALDRKPFQGRLLHILGAVDRTGRVEEGEGKKSLKEEKATKKKAAAGKDFNWSMLYMNVGSLLYSSLNVTHGTVERRCCILHRGSNEDREVRHPQPGVRGRRQ